MLAVIAVATVAAIGVIAYHIEGPTELLAKPHAFVKHGQLVHPIHIILLQFQCTSTCSWHCRQRTNAQDNAPRFCKTVT